MSKLINILLLVTLSFLFVSCSNPSIVNIKTAKVKDIKSKVIFIPRFEGNPNYVEESTDYFISLIEQKSDVRIIQGSAVRTESTDIHSGGNIAPLTLAIEDAKTNKADILVLGKVTSYRGGDTLNGFSTVRLYDVRTREKIANFHEPSGLLFANSQHQTVMAAVKNTANHFINLLK